MISGKTDLLCSHILGHNPQYLTHNLFLQQFSREKALSASQRAHFWCVARAFFLRNHKMGLCVRGAPFLVRRLKRLCLRQSRTCFFSPATPGVAVRLFGANLVSPPGERKSIEFLSVSLFCFLEKKLVGKQKKIRATTYSCILHSLHDYTYIHICKKWVWWIRQ